MDIGHHMHEQFLAILFKILLVMQFFSAHTTSIPMTMIMILITIYLRVIAVYIGNGMFEVSTTDVQYIYTCVYMYNTCVYIYRYIQ